MFKEGERVRVKKHMIVRKHYRMRTGEGQVLTESMKDEEGKEFKISRVNYQGYILEGAGPFWWTDEMLEPAAKRQSYEHAEEINMSVEIVVPVDKLIYSDPATVMIFRDVLGKKRKVIAKTMPEDKYDKEKGRQICLLKAVQITTKQRLGEY